MKFPKSMHAEGFYDHIDTAPARAAAPPAPKALRPRAGARPLTGAGSVLRAVEAGRRTPPPTAPASAAPTAVPAPQSTATPWLLGAGAGIVLIGLGVAISRQLPQRDLLSGPMTQVGQVTPSPEDAQLQRTPPGAGADVAASGVQPSTDVPPSTATAVPQALAQAPTSEAPPANHAEAASRRLAPSADTVAQALPPTRLREPAPATPPTIVTPPPALPESTPPVAMAPSSPPATSPLTPPPAAASTLPLAQAAPAASLPEPEDSGITVKVRQALAADATLAAVSIAVSTDHGVVKLEGQAPDAQVRERATVVAASTSGVKAVDNRLTLPPVASLDAQPARGG